MRATGLSLFVLLVGLMGVALWQGTETFTTGLQTSTQQLLRFLPVLVLAMLISGFAETLLPPNLVENWLSESSGWRGILIAWVAGILTPGGSIIGLPLVATMYKAGVGVSVLMTYATSFVLLSVLRIPLEIGFYGWRLTSIRVGVSLFLPLIAGFTTQFLLPLIEPV
ncbi:MAG: permease [Anaerolineae bacterium]